MEGQVVGLAWQDLLVLAQANGLEQDTAALLLQPVELKMVLALNGEACDDE